MQIKTAPESKMNLNDITSYPYPTKWYNYVELGEFSFFIFILHHIPMILPNQNSSRRVGFKPNGSVLSYGRRRPSFGWKNKKGCGNQRFTSFKMRLAFKNMGETEIWWLGWKNHEKCHDSPANCRNWMIQRVLKVVTWNFTGNPPRNCCLKF